MSLNKLYKNICLGLLFTLGSIGYGNAKTTPISCPESFIIGDQVYPLNNASLFDGPIENRGELVPEMTEHTRTWKIDPRMDPYLICRFDQVKHTVTFHVTGAKACTVNESPFTVKCN